jgi:uncharacterized membrane protein YfcA
VEFSPDIIAGLVLLGAVAGTLAGMLGIGGGVINVPALTVLFGLTNVLFIKGIVFTTMIFTVVSSAARHLKSGFVLPAVVKRLAPLAFVGVIAGYFCSRSLPVHVFKGIFALFLLYVVAMNGCRLLWPKGRKVMAAGEEKKNGLPVGRAVWIGGPMGFVAGVLAIGGGSLAGPGLQVFARMPLKNAIACSSVAMIPLVAVAVVLSYIDGFQGNFGVPWWNALAASACMIPGAVGGAWLGAWLTKVLPVRGVRVVFVLVLLVTALKMLQSAFLAA